MHLHTLTVEALGPFPGRHTVDLATLGASGIFLLEGPTGAGKSTLIDAIVFALYGKVASRDASEERLRSGYAAPDTETVVDLVFECGAGVFRVRRTPAYQRPKQRGSGTTTQQATVRLWRLTDPDAPEDGELLSHRLDEAGAELQRLVGLDRAQFVQTVVLPQGEFAAFLRANPEDRRGLLQKVFGTEVYDQVQRRLEQMRAEVGRGLERAREDVGRSVAHLCGAAALDDVDVAVLEAALAGASAADDGAALVDLVDRHSTRLTAVAAAATERAEEAAAVQAAARAALDAARALVGLLRRRDALRSELVALDAAQAEHERDVERLAAARRAQAVLPLLLGAEQAARTLVTARQRTVTARAAAGPELWAVAEEDADPRVQRKALGVERDRCTALRGELKDAVQLEARLGARRAELRAAEESHAALLAEQERVRAVHEARPAARLALTERLDQARAGAGALTGAEARATAAAEVLRAAADVATLTAQVARTKAAVGVAARRADEAVTRAAELQRARIAGIAGELAAGLVAGEPCAVCGGTDHPRPAVPDPARVTPEEVERAEVARGAAQAEVEALMTTLAAQEGRLTALTDAARGLDVAAARAGLATVEAEVADARAARAEVEEVLVALDAHDAGTRELDARLSGLATRAATAQAEVVALGERLRQEGETVEAARDGAGSVAERVAALDTRVDRLTAWSEALGAVEDATDQLEVRSDELAGALADHGFDDEAAVRVAHLDAAATAALDRRVTAHRADLARVRGGLDEPEVRELAEDVQVDLTAVEETYAAAEAARAEVSAEAARCAQRAAAARSAAEGVRTAVAAWTRHLTDAGPVVRMANLAAASGADNAKQLSLATYVLMRRFEDVVAAANARLVTMSSGRYELARSDEREAVRARRTGLAMKVVDHRTGTERDPRTLSGGETFYVSLCLALGLADVVTAEAGGTRLGTLFVDEGFGSLDPETLDVVLAELGRLRDGGRVVGVVSHVEALKQSIAERIEVRHLPGGGSTLTVRA